MTNSEAKFRMLSLLESCENYEQVATALANAIETQWADDSDVPASVGVALDAIRAAAETLALVDADCA